MKHPKEIQKCHFAEYGFTVSTCKLARAKAEATSCAARAMHSYWLSKHKGDGVKSFAKHKDKVDEVRLEECAMQRDFRTMRAAIAVLFTRRPSCCRFSAAGMLQRHLVRFS